MKRLVLLVFLFAVIPAKAESPVRIWEGTISIPTYRVNPPEKAPMFAHDFAYQRAKRWVYPYAMNDNPTNERVDSLGSAVGLSGTRSIIIGPQVNTPLIIS